MLLKTFGILDLLSALGITVLHFDFGGWKIAILISIYFGVKLKLFFGDFGTWIDVFVGIYCWLILLGFTSWFDYLIIVYLLTKAAMSLT